MKTGEMLKATGVTARQAEHWIRKGYIKGGLPGSGHHRDWPEAEVRRIKTIAALTNAGVELEVAAAVATQLEGGETTVNLGDGVSLQLAQPV